MHQATPTPNMFGRFRAILFGTPAAPCATRVMDHTELALLHALEFRAEAFQEEARTLIDSDDAAAWEALAVRVERFLIHPIELLAAQSRQYDSVVGKLLQDALWELASVASMADTMLPEDPEDRDMAFQCLDEARRLLIDAQQVAA